MSNATPNQTTPDNDHLKQLIVVLDGRAKGQSEILHLIAESLQEIEAHLHQIALSSYTAPNYQRPLSEYPNFDWSSIGATVLKKDQDGVSSVEWNGQVFTRRSPNNNFNAAVWLSRCVGKDADGKNKYIRLITFKAPSEAEPIAAKAKKAIGS